MSLFEFVVQAFERDRLLWVPVIIIGLGIFVHYDAHRLQKLAEREKGEKQC